MSALLDISIRVSAIVLLALGAMWLLRRSSAAARHWVLAAAFACAAASPLVGLVVPSWHIQLASWRSLERANQQVDAPTASVAAEATRPQSGVSSVQTVVSAGDEASGLARGTPVGYWLIPIWIAGAAASVCILLIGLARLRWLQSRSRPVLEGSWPEIAAEIAQQHRLPRSPLLLQSDHPTLLVTWGLLRSKVILPATAPNWTEERIRVVLGHELAHVRRRDWLVQMAAELVRSAYWFNPVLWIGCRRLRQESEQACDDAVLQMGIEGPTYASHLLDLARGFRAHRRTWLPAPAIARQSSLERRVSAMLNTRLNRDPVTPLAGVAAVVALLIVTVPIAGFEAFAQNRFATVSGSITDETAGLLRGVTLVLSNVQTKAKHEVRSDETGYFNFVGLPAGDYDLEARIVGFETLKDHVTLGVGESLQRNIVLPLGTVQEEITVTPDIRIPPPRVLKMPRATTRPTVGPCGSPTVGGCIAPPLKIKDVPPIYPLSLVGSGIRGTVTLDGNVGTDGRIKDLKVIASPHPDFEKAALDAVEAWEFAPTMLNGRVVETRIAVNVDFRPQPPPPPPPPAPPQ